LQQVLRYPSVEEALVCELYQRVVDLSREYFTASFGDPWTDPRAKLLMRDAFGSLEENPGGGIGFMYVSDTPWTKGLEANYPPGENKYLLHQQRAIESYTEQVCFGKKRDIIS
jgi:hypothetical protein